MIAHTEEAKQLQTDNYIQFIQSFVRTVQIDINAMVRVRGNGHAGVWAISYALQLYPLRFFELDGGGQLSEIRQ